MKNRRYIIREPDKAYVSDMLWLPKNLIAKEAVKSGLEYWDVKRNTATVRRLWEETEHHLVCPREFIKPEQYTQFPFPFVDATVKEFPKANFAVINEPRNDEQRAAYAALRRSHGGILNLACGKGKSFLSLKHAAEIGRPTLIVVHNSFLLNQWVEQEIPKHVLLPAGEKVGVIQGPQFDWERPLAVAMIQTLASKVEDGKIPPDFRRHFGTVIYDEVHHLAAPVFVTTAPLITGYRLGLTATEKRIDGFDFIYKYHLGDVFYTDLKQELIPRIYFQLTPVYVDLAIDEVRDTKGEVNIGKLRSFVGELDASNQFRASCIREAQKEGRKILCVSHSKKQLIALHEMFPGSGLVIQEVDPAERTAIVRRSQVTFAISRLGFEGLDDDNIDTVFILLPFGSKNDPPNDLQQVIGRAQRSKSGKSTPVIIIFDDVRVAPFHAMAMTMRNQLAEWDKHSPGMPPLTFTVLKAP